MPSKVFAAAVPPESAIRTTLNIVPQRATLHAQPTVSAMRAQVVTSQGSYASGNAIVPAIPGTYDPKRNADDEDADAEASQQALQQAQAHADAIRARIARNREEAIQRKAQRQPPAYPLAAQIAPARQSVQAMPAQFPAETVLATDGRAPTIVMPSEVSAAAVPPESAICTTLNIVPQRATLHAQRTLSAMLAQVVASQGSSASGNAIVPAIPDTDPKRDADEDADANASQQALEQVQAQANAIRDRIARNREDAIQRKTQRLLRETAAAVAQPPADPLADAAVATLTGPLPLTATTYLNQDSAASTYTCSTAAAATRLIDLQDSQPLNAPLVAAAVQQQPSDAAAAAAAASCQLPAVAAAICQVPTVAVTHLAAAAASCTPCGMDQPGSVGIITGQPGPSTGLPGVKVGGNADPDVKMCCICKEPLIDDQGKERMAMECMHVFHKNCIQEYMQISGLSFWYACPFKCFHEEIRVAQELQDAEDADPEPALAIAISVPAPDEMLQAAIAIA
jgi:hypothetical protein